MLNLSGYFKIKAFIEAYVLSDNRIPDKSFVWGPDKRLLDKQASNMPSSPYFWVSEYRQIQRAFQENAQIYIGWELKIEIKEAVGGIDKIHAQERALENTLNILNDFTAFLVEKDKQGEIIISIDSRAALPDEGFEMAGNWGWEKFFTIAMPINCYKPTNESKTVIAFIPVWSGSAGNLTLSVSAQEASVAWSEEKRITETLYLLAKAINDTAAPETAFTNGAVLFIRNEVSGEFDITFDLETNNSHRWETIEIKGR